MESNLHIGIYEKRTDINSIIHVHSPYATGFAFSDMKLKQLEGFGPITNKYIKTVDYFKPGSDKLASHVKEACGEDNSLILKNHGLICYEKNMDEAILLTEYIEKIAKTQFISHMLNL